MQTEYQQYFLLMSDYGHVHMHLAHVIRLNNYLEPVLLAGHCQRKGHNDPKATVLPPSGLRDAEIS